MDRETIAAIATPIGSGGIGIIKISGTKALKIADIIFKPKLDRTIDSRRGKNHSLSLNPHKITYGHIIHPENHQILDEVMASFMPGPKSYTREDVVEINTHSGAAALNAVLDLILRYGARMAEPGEFTKRAFLNGRIDLTQAEGVMDIINARTKKSLEFAANQIVGDLKRTIQNALASLTDILIKIEATIDFPEEVNDVLDKDEAVDSFVTRAITPLKALLSQYENARLLKEGVKIVIVGKPNVGKSSLMNCLVKKDRAIVSSVPGTTRDFIEEACIIENIPVLFIDTAGLHDTCDRVERIGIQKTVENVLTADVILFVVDISQPMTREDIDIYEKIKEKEIILVKNKMDLVEKKAPVISSELQIKRQILVSALLCQGIEGVEKAISDCVFDFNDNDVATCRIALNFRHKKLMESTVKAIESAIMGIQNNIPAELTAIDIKEAVGYLEEILGVHISIDVLDQIFARFCIGK